MGFSIRNANESDPADTLFRPNAVLFSAAFYFQKDHFQIGIKQYFQQAFPYSTHITQ
jgi:hypothetical protein